MNNEVMFSSGKDDWETPYKLFDELDKEFGFTLDPCATHINYKCGFYFTKENDGLKESWEGETVFCNPPYSRKTKDNPGQEAWIKKSYEESQKNSRTTIVMLLPARTDTIAFHKYIYGKSEIRFIKGRLKFVGAKATAPFPSMIVIYKKVSV